MRKKAFWITSESILIFISAILGTFSWNHGADIFSKNSPYRWLEALRMDIEQYPLAWIAFAIFLGLLIWLLYWRSKHDSEYVTKENIQQVISLLTIIAEKIGALPPSNVINPNSENDRLKTGEKHDKPK